MKIMHVVGARPNFIKADPLIKAMDSDPYFEQMLVHTGQHYDSNMSKIFFEELNIKVPDINLGVGSATHAVQTAEVMKGIEPVIRSYHPDMLFVYGDVNSTLASAITATKLGVKISHIESGLRSFDKSMPEEINRIVTDRISDILFIHSPDAADNLSNEGICDSKIQFVGNTMIDTLVRLLPDIDSTWNVISHEFPLNYILATLHRPSNVDNKEVLFRIIDSLNKLSEEIPVIFSIHPRTASMIKKLEISFDNIIFLKPLGYKKFMALQKNAKYVITDSGGIQEETTYLNIPCFTIRPNTERPITITQGSNTLVNPYTEDIYDKIKNTSHKKASIPDLWDGQASIRIINIIKKL